MSWLCPHRLDFESAFLHGDENLHNSACGIEWWYIFNDFFYPKAQVTYNYSYYAIKSDNHDSGTENDAEASEDQGLPTHQFSM